MTCLAALPDLPPGIHGVNCYPLHKKRNLPMKPWQFGSRSPLDADAAKQATDILCAFFLGGG